MDELKVGVIGAGVMGGHHTRLYAGMPGVHLLGVADKNPVVLSRIKREFNVTGFPDYRDLLALGLDAVSIAVPTSLHCKTALAAIASGCHVLLEKPIAGNSTDARRIIKAAQYKRLKLMVGHTERFNPAVAAVKSALKGEEIISLDMTRVGPLPPRVKDVGIIIDLAIHDLDLIRHLTGAEVRKTYSLNKKVAGPHEDTAMILLKLTNGAMAHITTNWLTPFKARTIQIATARKFIIADLLTQTVSIYSRVRASEDGGLVRKIELPFQEPLKLELESFMRSIRKNTEVPITGEDGMKALKMAEKCLA